MEKSEIKKKIYIHDEYVNYSNRSEVEVQGDTLNEIYK